MTLRGSHWVRKSDNTLICIEGDSEGASGRGNRSLLARNKDTGRTFWLTPEGLGRKYYAVKWVNNCCVYGCDCGECYSRSPDQGSCHCEQVKP